ncbi:glucan endo-1,3-beta-glucosidase-like isoform X2 [Macadamia integrifolia]|uniref:glucan endo-1,3-beta-glucosidase-like isoform X2 n=1 Tax=Macadamia integrifolia TaxID=60698 RepID=UPI001C52F6F8|nr:glucan endo-1,3-beta-glucosidase-like isoform X2 [Macadamia integrifolia]
MEKTINATASAVSGLLFFLLTVNFFNGVQGSIGVNYGTVADNLPAPAEVARFLLQDTLINRVRLFDANPAILQAFAHTGVAITVTVPNEEIPDLTKLASARQWLKTNIIPYIPSTNIVRILVGNEILSTANKLFIANLLPSMENLHAALVEESLSHRIQVSTPHSLAILSSSSPPSTGKFRKGYDAVVLQPVLSFLRATGAPFMVNPYPFFGCSAETLDYALFQPNAGVLDSNTGHTYTNMLDAQLDAIFSAMKLVGFGDLEIVIAETGWPSIGDPAQVGVDAKSAAEYNGNLIRHVNSGIGTPLMPNRTFETYVFALFNEDLKPGPTCERNFGLFRPDMTPVYDAGILRHKNSASIPINPSPVVTPVSPMPSTGKQWCVPKSGVDPTILQNNIDYVCGLGIDCRPIQAGGDCFLPNTVQAHAAYAMNAYFQAMGRYAYDCDFAHTGAITTVDPSNGGCNY